MVGLHIYSLVADTIVKSWGWSEVYLFSPPSSPPLPSWVLVWWFFFYKFWITNEGFLRTCSVVHPGYTTRKHVSKPLPSPNLGDRLPLYPHYPGNQESGGILFSLMIDGMPVELYVLPLQTVVQDQASYVQDQKVSTLRSDDVIN